MVVDAKTDRVFQALADVTRREIVSLVLSADHSVSDLAERFPMSFAAVQKHVAVLERAGLVTKERHGREQRVSGNVKALREAHRLLDRLEDLWRGRVERIDQLLAEPVAHPDPEPDHPPEPDREVRPQSEPAARSTTCP